MGHFYSFTRETVEPQLWDSYMRWRYREFVARLKWTVPNDGTRETGDEWDNVGADAQGNRVNYVVYIDDDGEVRGGGRQIPCTRPCMVSSLWPELLGDHPAPEGGEWLEGTRAGIDSTLPKDQRRLLWLQLSIVGLERAYAHGFRNYVFVTYAELAVSALQLFDCTLFTEPKEFDDGRYVAGFYKIDMALARRLRKKIGFYDRLVEAVPTALEYAA